MNRLIKCIGLCVAMLAGSQAMAGVTFYESENFGGRRVEGNDAMPNFRALDFNDRAQSAIIEGGPWEVCVGTNFDNKCTVLAPGRYPSLGEWSRKISSARPVPPAQANREPPGVVSQPPGQVTFYESGNFGGRHLSIQQPSRSLEGMRGRDWPQSAIVEGGAWEICVDADFHGDCRVFVPGRYPTLGGLAGRVSSARPANDGGSEPPRGRMSATASATLYSEPNFSGRTLTLGGQGSSNLDGSFNDRASSLRIERGYWIFCSDANFEGECRTFGPGEYPRLPSELDNRISSGRRISNDYPYSGQPSWR
jgi:hypothetical protein